MVHRLDDTADHKSFMNHLHPSAVELVGGAAGPARPWHGAPVDIAASHWSEYDMIIIEKQKTHKTQNNTHMRIGRTEVAKILAKYHANPLVASKITQFKVWERCCGIYALQSKLFNICYGIEVVQYMLRIWNGAKS